MEYNNKTYYLYLETSSVNFLTDNFRVDELLLIKHLFEEKNYIFCISSTTISEILCTSDEFRKEKLIFVVQNICTSNLINSPAEFIINYINAGMPRVEEKYDFYSEQELAKTWKELCENTSKTFIYDAVEFKEKIKFLQKSFKELSNDLFKEEKELQKTIEYAIKKDKDFHTLNEYEINIKRISWLLIFLILCCEVSDSFFDNSCISNYWDKLGITNTLMRLLYTIEKLNDLTNIGPIVIMAHMWAHQIETNNRGTLLDMFHSIYLVYCDAFLTNDIHFLKLKENLEHVNCNKIQFISDNTFFNQIKKILETYNKTGCLPS